MLTVILASIDNGGLLTGACLGVASRDGLVAEEPEDVVPEPEEVVVALLEEVVVTLEVELVPEVVLAVLLEELSRPCCVTVSRSSLLGILLVLVSNLDPDRGECAWSSVSDVEGERCFLFLALLASSCSFNLMASSTRDADDWSGTLPEPSFANF